MQGFAFAANVRNDGPHCSMVEDAPRSAMGRKQTREPVRFWEQAAKRHSDLMHKSGPLYGPLLYF